jgi:PAS domain S-box-containing protein
MHLNEGGQVDRRVLADPDLLVGIIGSAMDAIIAIDDSQRIVLFNAAAEKIFACPANEAIGSSVERLIPHRFRSRHIEHIRHFAECGATSRTFRDLGTLWGLRATGEEFPMEASISKIESSGKNFFTAVVRDITERYRAEEAVRESEERFRLVADTAPVLIWMSGPDKLCNYFNKPWLDFTGRLMEEELGNGWTKGVHPDDLERCLQTYTQFFDRREKFRMEYRLRRHDGEYRWILDIGVPRFDPDGAFAGYIGACVDVTDRKRAEEIHSRHTALVQSSDDAIVATDLSGTVTDWNKGAERFLVTLRRKQSARVLLF